MHLITCVRDVASARPVLVTLAIVHVEARTRTARGGNRECPPAAVAIDRDHARRLEPIIEAVNTGTPVVLPSRQIARRLVGRAPGIVAARRFQLYVPDMTSGGCPLCRPCS